MVTDNEEKQPNSSATSLAASLVEPDFQGLANILATKLQGFTVGYSFVVSYKGQYKTTRAGGQARQLQDPPTRSFTMYDKYSTASVSKTITAAALIKQLSIMPGGISNLDKPIWPYLPSHWALGANIKTITFKQLLTHSSGFRYTLPNIGDGDDYATLKKLFAYGIILSNKYPSYNNRNYAILRLIIPKLANYSIAPVTSTYPPILAALENVQAVQFANAYKDYCRKTIFNYMGTTTGQQIDCVNADTYPGACYAFPKGSEKGVIPGDLTLSSAAQGWVLNTSQVADFFSTLHYTTSILPATLSNLMRDQKCGYDARAKTNDNVGYYWKNGIYNFGSNTGYRSLIIGFDDGIQISIMTNSRIVLENLAIAAHQEWYK